MLICLFMDYFLYLYAYRTRSKKRTVSITFQNNFKLMYKRLNKHTVWTKITHTLLKLPCRKYHLMMPFKCLNRYKIVLRHLRLSLNVANTVLMCKICIK